jgi:hypothetical protein
MINKATFLRDLEFYGVLPVVPDDDNTNEMIMQDAIDESNANLQAAHRIIALDRECDDRAKKLKDERVHSGGTCMLQRVYTNWFPVGDD